jgi:hypothetical protein
VLTPRMVFMYLFDVTDGYENVDMYPDVEKIHESS